MKLGKRALAVFVGLIAIVGCCACGEEDLRLFQNDIKASLDGAAQQVYYDEWTKPHEPKEDDLVAWNYDMKIYLATHDSCKTIEGTEHDVSVKFEGVKPDFEPEEIRFVAICRKEDASAEGGYVYGHVPVDCPVTDFSCEKGEVKFHFSIGEKFANELEMFCVTLWYDYDVRNVYLPMIISEGLKEEKPIEFPEYDDSHVRPSKG